MSSRDADRRAERLDSHPEGSQRNWREEGLGASSDTATRDNSEPEAEQLLEAVVERKNMWLALKQVERNSGAAGVDNMTVEQLRTYLHEHWPRIKAELLAGDYQPQPVLKVEIPKRGGKGRRMLGIPTVVDRLIEQALHQVLSPRFEPDFSDSSYGFRPQRSAHQAVLKARQYVREGRRWVVDIDLEKFFDRVNHDILMSRLARRIKDKRVLRLIRRYLQAGMMSNGGEKRSSSSVGAKVPRLFVHQASGGAAQSGPYLGAAVEREVAGNLSAWERTQPE
jgi:RNA-directed DNA polymerase